MEKLLDELFNILKFSEDTKKELKKLFEETLKYNLATSVIEGMTEEQKTSFQAYIKDKGLNEKNISLWFAENMGKDKENMKQKVQDVTQKTIKDFFHAITQDATDDKKKNILSFLEKKAKYE